MKVGVVVARFQIDELHAGHQELLHRVARESDVLCVVLGGNENRGSKRNPLDFICRKAMVEDWYCFSGNSIPLVVLFQQDQTTDEVWTENLDRMLRQTFPGASMVLYGGRDSFLSHYKGKSPMVDLTADLPSAHNATEVRARIAKSPGVSPEFRRGVIYGAYNNWPRLFMCVDIAAVDNDWIYVGKRNNEEKCRFFGGFVDQNDLTLELAAHRELREEAGLEQSTDLAYLGSYQVPDFRYRTKDDGLIMTTFFCATGFINRPEAGDDIDSIRCLPYKLDQRDAMIDTMVKSHQPLMRRLLTHLEEQGKFNE